MWSFLCTVYDADILYIIYGFLILLCVVFFSSHMSLIIRIVFSVSVKGEASYCDPKKSVLMCQTRCTLSLSNLHAIVLWFINIKRRTRINALLLNILSWWMILHHKYPLSSTEDGYLAKLKYTCTSNSLTSQWNWFFKAFGG